MGGAHPAGGSLALGQLITDHGAALLADLLRFYGLDLADVLRPGSGLSPRRVLALAEQLPEDSATVASLRGGPEHRGWTGDRYLLAALADAARLGNWQRGGGHGRRPQPVARPRLRRRGAAAGLISRTIAGHRARTPRKS
ncbi:MULTISPECIES: hypothetical protein [unclassified Crossiella]|uniref:hypothetical protein n=1 Tax=unclassified Crossiella TaxID=2620835 RepID=UPI001FFFE524|nr:MULTISPECIES: hypothetical protein [unclassified Crossiella]MCK2242318.1 hypothetical protein [Crossiella sp. S99.2]MCK2254651.1 hypothetical protein [Crossiella sp. S99.1]